MNRESLENLKIDSFMAMVISFIGVVMGIAMVYDKYQEKGSFTVNVILILFTVVFLVSTVLYIALRHYLKKLEGELYCGFSDIVKFLMENLIPSMRYREEETVLQKGKSIKSTNLWKKLCSGLCINNLVIFLALCCLEVLLICVAVAIYKRGNPAFSLSMSDVESSDMFTAVTLILMTVAILVYMIVVFLGIRRDGTLIFQYLDRSKVEFETLSRHFDNSKRCGSDIWVDEKYLFVVGNGKAHVIPLDEYQECSITYTRTYFICMISSTYDSVMKYGILPYKYKKMKRLIKEYQVK